MRTYVTIRSPAGLRSLIAGLRRGQDAATAGLTLTWSSGVVVGNINRKLIKRQVYGRASPDLLRRCVLGD